MYKFVYAEVNLLSAALLLIIIFGSRDAIDRKLENSAFNAVAIADLIAVLADTVWVLVDGATIPGLRWVNIISNVVYMAMTVTIAYSWLVFTMLKLNALPKGRTARALIALPFVTVVVMSILSAKTGWFFSVDAANVYHRGDLRHIVIFFPYVYLAASAVIALVAGYRSRTRQKRRESYTLCAFFILPAVGGFITSVVSFGIPLAWTSAALSLLMVFNGLQRELISRDSLTGLNNRRQFDRYLSSCTVEAQNKRPIFLLLIDINNFKRVNDTYGHLAGDSALIDASNILKRVCGKRSSFLARYGGDEFAMICEYRDAAYVQSLCDEIHAEFATYSDAAGTAIPLSVSIGVGEYAQDTDTTRRLIERADQELYKSKGRAR